MKGNWENITLIGMPASGKSTVGVLVAKRLGYQFIDGDLLIQQQEGKLLKEIIAQQGMDGFMEVESRTCENIPGGKCLIAPGGSVIYEKRAMAHLSEIGTIVYLKLDYKEFAARLRNPVDRGVVLKEGMTLKDLYDERTPLYEQYAEVTIYESDKDLGEVVDELRYLAEEGIAAMEGG